MAKANDLFNAGDSEGALALYDDVLSRNQDSFEVYCNRGAALDNLNRYTFTFFAAPPKLFAPLHSSSSCHLLLNRTAEALESYEKALELNPEYAEAHHNRAICLAKVANNCHASNEQKPVHVPCTRPCLAPCVLCS